MTSENLWDLGNQEWNLAWNKLRLLVCYDVILLCCVGINFQHLEDKFSFQRFVHFAKRIKWGFFNCSYNYMELRSNPRKCPDLFLVMCNLGPAHQAYRNLCEGHLILDLPPTLPDSPQTYNLYRLTVHFIICVVHQPRLLPHCSTTLMFTNEPFKRRLTTQHLE